MNFLTESSALIYFEAEAIMSKDCMKQIIQLFEEKI